jgi:hypothetical protein
MAFRSGKGFIQGNIVMPGMKASVRRGSKKQLNAAVKIPFSPVVPLNSGQRFPVLRMLQPVGFLEAVALIFPLMVTALKTLAEVVWS